MKAYRQKLLDGEVPIGDLIISKHLSKNPKHYKQHGSQVIAADQLIKEGSEVHAGNSVKFVFTHSEDKRYERRVRAAQLIDEKTNPDNKRYLFCSILQLLTCSVSRATQPNQSMKQSRDKTKETCQATGAKETNCLVRLQFRIIKKSYKNGLSVYKHQEVTLNFPKELHELLRFLSDKKLEIKGYREGNKVHLVICDKEEPLRKTPL